MQQPTPTSLPLLQGRYRIEERLGVGRLAVVYRAYDERLQRQVLIHMLRRELADREPLRARFLEESQNSARRVHRSLLEVYDSGELAGRPFIVTEHVAGRTLREIVPLSLEDALLYFRQIVGAIATCQAAGVPHPPISSSNIILVGDGHVELLESWLLEPAEVARDQASYRAPERAAGGPILPASAVYSLGLLLLEMLSGQRVIDGTEPQAIAQAHQAARIPLLSQLQPRIHAPALDTLIQRATMRAPEQRFPDAAALARALEELRQSLSSETQRLARPPARPSLPERARRSTGKMLRRAPQPQPPIEEPPAALSPQQVAPAYGRSVIGFIIMLALFLAVGFGAYYTASVVAEQLINVQLPRPQLNLPDLGFDLPEWLTGVASGGGEVMIVTIRDSEGLNLRASPGLNTDVIALLPNGTRVRKVGESRLADSVEWVPVRVQLDGREVEGWLSALYVKPA